MEKQIFTWERWSEIDTAFLNFENCKIIKDFGPIKVGQHFDWINMSCEDLFFEFGMNDDNFEPILVNFRLVPDTTE